MIDFTNMPTRKGSHIFEIISIPVQETILGTYHVNGKEKVVVACKDFT